MESSPHHLQHHFHQTANPTIVPSSLFYRTIDANINWLTKISAASRDGLHLNTKCLNAVYNWTLDAHAVSIQNQQRHNSRISCIPPRDQHQVDTFVNHSFIHPSFWLASTYALFWISLKLICFNSSICFTFESQHRLQQLTACHDSHRKCRTLGISGQCSHVDCLGSLLLQCPIGMIRIGNWGMIHIHNIIWSYIHDFLPCHRDEVQWFFFGFFVVFCTTWAETQWESPILLMNQLTFDIFVFLDFSLKSRDNWNASLCTVLELTWRPCSLHSNRACNKLLSIWLR